MLPETTLAAAPHAPGVYLMRDLQERVLYVGKAKDLYKRLSSYARFSPTDHSKTSVMLAGVRRVETIITATEKEALILEASLIKEHKPKYNIILRDDKSYPYIKVTVADEWPRVSMARRKGPDRARYFGPYSSASAMWATLRLIAGLFPLRNCKGSRLKARPRPCLNQQIGRCLAPCAGLADRRLYLENVDKIIMLLEGRGRALQESLAQQMHRAAEALDFERAAQLRDQLADLRRTLEKQVVSAGHGKDQDVFGLARKDAAVAVAVLHIRQGLLNGSRNFFLADPYGEDTAILAQVLGQFYHSDHPPPQEILLPLPLPDQELYEEYLQQRGGIRVSLKFPKRGDGQQLLAMATANAQQHFAAKEQQSRSWESLSQALVKTLRLARPPERIECLDISNIGGKQAVGALVCFRDGEPDKGNYRHYRIKTVAGPDDYAMMRESLERRLRRGLAEGSLPDLLLVDGGKGQLGMALAVAGELGIREQIDWLGIAKEREEEGEKLFKPGQKNPLLLPAHNPVLLYLMRIRDEAHRYGITFHRRLRRQSTLASELEEVPGIGQEKKNQLLRHLGSLRRIKAASLAELQTVPGIGPELAGQIFAHFHPTT
jgi:excinuclease ABC subunit C